MTVLPQPAQEHLGPVRTARLRAHTGEQKKTYTGAHDILLVKSILSVMTPLYTLERPPSE